MAERPFARAVADAADGLARALREQRNLRIHVALGILAIAVAALLHFNATRWALLSLTIAVVLAAELVNTSLERVVDCVSPGEQNAARQAKHAAAAAVLVASIGALVVGAWLYGGAWLQR